MEILIIFLTQMLIHAIIFVIFLDFWKTRSSKEIFTKFQIITFNTLGIIMNTSKKLSIFEKKHSPYELFFRTKCVILHIFWCRLCQIVQKTLAVKGIKKQKMIFFNILKCMCPLKKRQGIRNIPVSAKTRLITIT